MKLADLPPTARAKIDHMLKPSNDHGLDPDQELPTPTGYHVLCLQYHRPEKVGSIILADQTIREDMSQGRVGVVLALGESAYGEARFPEGPWCAPGDFVAWPALENTAGRVAWGRANLVFLTDDRVALVDVDPAMTVGR
jgi:hypothetical protein